MGQPKSHDERPSRILDRGLGGLAYSELERLISEKNAAASEMDFLKTLLSFSKAKGWTVFPMNFWHFFNHVSRNYHQPQNLRPYYELLHPNLALHTDFTRYVSTKLVYNLREEQPSEFMVTGRQLQDIQATYRFLFLPQVVSSTKQWTQIRRDIFFDKKAEGQRRKVSQDGTLFWNSWDFSPWQMVHLNGSTFACYWGQNEKHLREASMPSSAQTPSFTSGLPQPVR